MSRKEGMQHKEAKACGTRSKALIMIGLMMMIMITATKSNEEAADLFRTCITLNYSEISTQARTYILRIFGPNMKWKS